MTHPWSWPGDLCEGFFSQHVALWSSGCCLLARDGPAAEPAGKWWSMGGGYETPGSGALLRARLG